MADEDLDLSQYNGNALVGTAAVFLAISWFSVGLRTYTRAFLMHSFQLDDWFMLIAQIIFTTSCAFILLGVNVGLGHHNDFITNDDKKVAALMWQALATATYVIDMMFIKLSIGVFLLRISAQKVYTWILRGSLVVITIWSTVIFIWDIFQCNPVQKQWDYRIETGHCVSAAAIVSAAYAISVMTIVSDWLYALLPVPMLWKVKMTKQAKATVIVILGLGIFASIATLIRLKFLSDLENTDDILFAGTDAMVWTLVEPGVAIVASSLATIRPLLRAMKVRGFESSDYAYGTGRSGTRSAAIRSKTGNGPASMPGYGPNDVSLSDVEPSKPESRARIASNSIGLFRDNKSLPSLPVTPIAVQSPVRSEMFVIEGNGKHEPPKSPWNHGGSSRSPSNSFDQIHDLEAQSQELPSRLGLGDGRRRD